MEGRKPPFFTEEAAVAELAKGCFCDNTLIKKDLFKISEGAQNALKPLSNASKSGRKKNFHFGDFGVKKWEK